MVKLSDTRQLLEIELEALTGGIVKVHTSLLAGDMEKVLLRGDGKTGFIFPLSILIKEWNLEDESGNPLPITEENVGKLDIKDVNLIFEKTGLTKGFLSDSK